jgi:hypothetical protein
MFRFSLMEISIHAQIVLRVEIEAVFLRLYLNCTVLRALPNFA